MANMHYYLDSEFIDDGHTIDLISIGIVSSDGREYYAQSTEFNEGNANSWVRKHVLEHLAICTTEHDYPLPPPHYLQSKVSHDLYRVADGGVCRLPDCPWRTRLRMMHEVANFFQPDGEHTPFELWGWCSAYDYVALCQLFGTMMDIPQGWPHYIRDLQYLLDERGIADEQLPPQEDAHHALADARYIKKIWEMLHT